MATTAPDNNDRFPTAGPDDRSYDCYRFDTTTDGEALIYDDTAANAWVQSSRRVSLEEWR